MNSNRNSRLPDWALWIIVTSTVLAAAILIFSAVLGVRAGQRQLEIQTRQRLGIHLQQAIDYRTDGDLEAALAEYSKVLILDPSNVAAVEGIESLLQIARGTNSGSVATAPDATTSPETVAAQDQPTSSLPSNAPDSPLPPVEPTSTPAPSELEKAWEEAQIAYTSGQWEDAVEQLEQVRSITPNFEAGKVADMLYTAYVNLGAEKDRSGNLEEALALVDKALDLNPGATELRTARRVAADYLDVLTYFGADWERAVELLEEIYARNPDYRDVEARLQEALVAYGGALFDAKEWCEAEDHFIAALDLDVTPGLIDKRDAARDRCTDRQVASAATQRPGVTRPSARATRTTVATATTTGAADESPTGSPTSQDANPSAGSTPVVTPDADTPDAQETAAPIPAPATGSPKRGKILISATNPDDGRSRIFAVGVSGGQPQLLFDDGTQPAMRSDGQRVAYYNTRQDMAGISSFDSDTGLNLRFTIYAEDRRPTWSPDGNRIALSSNREGDRRWRVYVAWAETDGETINLGFGESPAWHPSADSIAFRGCDETGNRCGLWSMNGSGSGRSSMTSVPEDTLPAWSPDGRYVVFTSHGRHGNYELYRVDAQTGDVLRLTDNPANDGVGAVSPDGRWVAFLSDRDGVWRVWAVPINGGKAVTVADIPGNVGNWLEQSIQWIN